MAADIWGRARPGGSRGFSLVEALVALVIAGGVVTAYYGAMASSLDLARRSEASAEAAVIAGALLDQIGHEIPLDPGGYEGRTVAGFGWRLRITVGAGIDAVTASEDLRRIEIDIAGPGLAVPYRLTTLRVSAEILR